METNKSSFIKGHYRQSIASRTLEKTKLTWPEFFGCIVKQSPVSFPSVWPLPNFGWSVLLPKQPGNSFRHLLFVLPKEFQINE